MITSLRIQNFKCWRDTGEMRLAPITGLFGANSSGKSSILQFLLMLKQTVESSDRNEVLHFGDDDRRDYVQLGRLSDVLFTNAMNEPAKNLEWSIRWTLPVLQGIVIKPEFHISAKQLELDVSIANVNPELNSGPIVKAYAYKFVELFIEDTKTIESVPPSAYSSSDFYGITMRQYEGLEYQFNIHGLTISTNGKQEIITSSPHKFYGLPKEIDRVHGSGVGLTNIPLFFEKSLEGTYYLGPLREPPKREYTWAGGQPSDVGQRGERVIPALLGSRSNGSAKPTVEHHVARWLKTLGLIEEFFLVEIAEGSGLYRVMVRQTPDSPFVKITDVGFGVSQVLPVLTLCYYVPEGSTIIFEQPEIHLHPRIQAGLADVFIEVAEERNIQILLESHSEHLLARLQRRMAEHGVRDEGISSDQVALYFCRREGTEAKLEELCLNNFGYITNWPKEFFGDEMNERVEMVNATIERQQRGETE